MRYFYKFLLSCLPLIRTWNHPAYNCTKHPVGRCTGPFTILSTSLPCTDVDSELLTVCITQCISSVCCRAVGVQQSQCVFNSKQDQSLHFIKTAPENIHNCSEGRCGYYMYVIILQLFKEEIFSTFCTWKLCSSISCAKGNIVVSYTCMIGT